MRFKNKRNILKLLIFIFIITVIIIGLKKLTPKSKAEEKITEIIQVTYKAGSGIGEDVTITQEVFGKQTQGENDYTDGKIVLTKNGENGVNFTHDAKEITIDGVQYNYDMLISGWKVVAVAKDGTEITTFVEPENYNYADKTNANKDIGTIIAEEGWYVVPDGVTSVTVEAVWGWAIYVKNPYNTMVYDTNYWFDTASSVASGRTGASEANFGTNSTDDAVASIKRAYEIIYLAGESGTAYDVYSHLIVLCGDIDDVRPSTSTVPDTTYADIVEGETIYDINQLNTDLVSTKEATNANNSFWGSTQKKEIYATFTSDPSQDTTYKIYQKCQTWTWSVCGGMRFDNVIYSLVKKISGSSVNLSSAIISPGWISDNYKIITTERFYTWNPNNTDTSLNNWTLTIYHWDRGIEIKILGGNIKVGANDHPKTTDWDLDDLKYILIGGNVHLIEFCSGTYTELNPTALKTIYNVPTVCVTGGYIEGIYLTGRSSVNYVGFTRDDKSIYFYMTDGCAKTIYGSGATPLVDGNVNINIENAEVNKLYGGGSGETGDVTGNVYINLKNMEIIDLYGGPEYGNIIGDVYLNVDNIKVYKNVYSAGYGANSTITTNLDVGVNSLTKNKSEVLELLNAGQEIEADYDNGIYYEIKTVDGQLRYYLKNERVDEFLNNSTKYLGFYNENEDQIVVQNLIAFNNSLTTVNLVDRIYIKSLSAATVRNVYANIANSNIEGDVFGGGNKGSVLENTELTITNTTIGGSVYGGGYSIDDTQVDVYTKQYSEKNMGYAYLNSDGTLGGYWGQTTNYYEDGVYMGALYESYTWSNLDYLRTNSADWTEEQLNSYLEVAASNGLAQETPNVIKGIDYTNKLIYSAKADRMGTVYGDVVLKVSNSTVGGEIYGGGNGGQVQGNVTEEIENIKTTKNIFGGGYIGNVGGNVNLTIISGSFTNIFGGGDQGYVGGNTTVTIGDETDAGIKVTGVVYGGGQGKDADGDGDASDFTTVKGSSQVTISGIKTEVENYGSIKLGKVDGEVDVTFKDYQTANATAKYKRMNGIDRATTVSFENSYVLLENKDEAGNLSGIKAIENINLPSGSGLKISADGEITGNFNGGGELYLDSAVCLTVGGDISEDVTTLTLNPELFEDEKVNKIIGGIENPYLKVQGNSLATEEEAGAVEFVSGDKRYEILAKKYTEEDGTEYAYYYIIETIILADYVGANSISVNDRIFTGTIENTQDIVIEEDGYFTSLIKLHYDLLANEDNLDKFAELTRDFVLKIDEQNLAVIPKGTEILMIFNNKYYTYIVEDDNVTKIPLTQFKDETGTEYTNFTNLREEENATTSTNEITGATTYRYDEEYRFIVNFENAETPVSSSIYYAMININDGTDSEGNEKWIDEDQLESANIIEMQNREYISTYQTDREDYFGDGVIKVTGEISISEIASTITQNTKDLSAKVSLKDSQNNVLEIPNGTIIWVGEQAFEVSNGIAQIRLLENVPNTAVKENVNITVDFSTVLPQDRLETGNYNLVLELVLSKNDVLQGIIKATSEIPVVINNIAKDTYGINVEILNNSGIEEDKLQLIQKENSEERTINLEYNGNLEQAKVKIKVVERTAPYTYEETENSQKVVTKINGKTTKEITSLAENQEILVQFGNKLDIGTYRIIFELYDKYNDKKTEVLVNFIVIE